MDFSTVEINWNGSTPMKQSHETFKGQLTLPKSSPKAEPFVIQLLNQLSEEYFVIINKNTDKNV